MRVFLLCLIFLSCSPVESVVDEKETVILDRISYIYNLKTVINQNAWKNFTESKYDLPLVYYTDSVCYVANPTPRFIDMFQPQLLDTKENLKIYKTSLLDSIPFHMETGLTFGSSNAYNNKSPFMNCSSFEITNKIINDVNTTEQWATMVLHEYFHGFQFKHPEFVDYFERNAAPSISEDSLKKVYKALSWYKESVDKENMLLLQAVNATDPKMQSKHIDMFFVLRKERRDRMIKETKLDITTVERVYETMEGSARYVEYSLYSIFSNKTPDQKLLASDSAYHSYSYFKNYNIEKDQWLYRTDKTPYFYATGFNMMRLLDKMNVAYKDRLFTQGDLALEDLIIH
jgi:hypothetical protein